MHEIGWADEERVARTTGFVVRVLCVAIIVTVSFSGGALNQARAADRNDGGLRYLLSLKIIGTRTFAEHHAPAWLRISSSLSFLTPPSRSA